MNKSNSFRKPLEGDRIKSEKVKSPDVGVDLVNSKINKPKSSPVKSATTKRYAPNLNSKNAKEKNSLKDPEETKVIQINLSGEKSDSSNNNLSQTQNSNEKKKSKVQSILHLQSIEAIQKIKNKKSNNSQEKASIQNPENNFEKIDTNEQSKQIITELQNSSYLTFNKTVKEEEKKQNNSISWSIKKDSNNNSNRDNFDNIFEDSLEKIPIKPEKISNNNVKEIFVI